jgi:hypothetical protein
MSLDLKLFTTKDKKSIDYYPSYIINKAENNTIFNGMMNKKKEYRNKSIRQEELKNKKFC